jgi:antitoxin (DNA-binding transcriptional repressor) of toxin-antitoxin stability system
MHEVSLSEAETCLPSLLDEALRGEEVVIFRDNVPSVKLVPIVRPGYGSLKGQVHMAEDFDAPLDHFGEYMP